LQHFGGHAFELCTKFERDQVIHGRVTDDLARFPRAILGVGHFIERLSGCVDPTLPNLAKT